ncbi:uncharacterized protein F5147DRAFT_781529 [Suillus discolor]|uniref:Uncharacterized protein n=1 Tax=Suillus discolor TaxID=1912936 RepID=A0A9P7JLQ8_9AGAM|nr:uncharacterized protein F5147DRAFT_781529 [Suillus discolor]KAG2086755.1 hypothetical protein F5147DRAFT_781529 [Suillus discolor]
MSLDFACYMLAGTSIGPCYWPADVAMTTDPPIGYIAMNDHSGPLVEDSGRAEYQVLVPIYGFTQQDDRTLYNVNYMARSTKLARWLMGFYWQPAFTTAMSFDGATYGHLTDYTVGSYDSQLGYLNVISSPGAHGPSTSPSIPSEDLMQPSGSMKVQ